MAGTTPTHWVLWSTVSGDRWYLIPHGAQMADGVAVLCDRAGHVMHVAPSALIPFEISQDQAPRWAKHELGQTLDDLKAGIDARLATLRERIDRSGHTPVAAHSTLTPNAMPALLQFLQQLPGVIANSLARDAAQVDAARTAMAELQRRLKEAGIDLDERFSGFPDRLGGLRDEFDSTRSRNQEPTEPPGQS